MQNNAIIDSKYIYDNIINIEAIKKICKIN